MEFKESACESLTGHYFQEPAIARGYLGGSSKAADEGWRKDVGETPWMM